MRSSAAGRRYARALFALAHEASQVAEIGGEIDSIRDLLAEVPELKDALFRPLHPVAERRAVLRAVAMNLEVRDTVRNFLVFLVDQRRLIDFDGIRDEYQRLADETAGRMRADIVTASPLSDGQRDRLERALSSRTGRQVELDVRVDADLIGGAVAKVGDVVFDGSIRTQLSQLRDTLTRGQ